MRTIRVTGTGTVRLKPDTMQLDVMLSGKEKEYTKALERSAADTAVIRQLVLGQGFAEEDLKTLSFAADPAYEGYEDKHGNWRQRLTGYEFHHRLKLVFPFDNDRLGRLLYALSRSGVTPEFTVSYTVKDREAAKNGLLAAAVRDAGQKAEVLARAAGLALGAVQSIDYSVEQPAFEVRPMNKMLARPEMAVGAAADSLPLDIRPDDVTAEDTVTVVWEVG